MSNLSSIILVALLGVVGNVIYFKYQSSKEKDREVLKNKLTNLLLPLFYILKNDELELHAWSKSDNVDIYEYISDQPDRLFKPLAEIIKNNLYLADDELHEACLLFVEWVYKSDSNDRFQRAHYDANFEEDKALESFRKIVYKNYNENRNEYLK